jgi:hypothetical protein
MRGPDDPYPGGVPIQEVVRDLGGLFRREQDGRAFPLLQRITPLLPLVLRAP